MKFHLSLLAALSLASAALAAPVAPTASFRFAPEGFKGDSTRLVVRVSVPKGWHIQSNAPTDSFLIPTTLRTANEELSFGKARFPKPSEEDFPVLGGKIPLFKGDFEVIVPAARKNSKVTAAALENTKVSLRYQACNNSQCLPPKEIVARYAP